MTTTRIRPAAAGDSPALAALHGTAFDQPWSAAAIGDLLAMPGAFGLIAEDSKGPCGFVLARAAGGEAEILTLAVAPAARRGGTGGALVRAAAAETQARGASRLFLEVAVDNKPALGLYTALGFAEAGRRRAYYARAKGPAADALILTANLPLGG